MTFSVDEGKKAAVASDAGSRSDPESVHHVRKKRVRSPSKSESPSRRLENEVPIRRQGKGVSKPPGSPAPVGSPPSSDKNRADKQLDDFIKRAQETALQEARTSVQQTTKTAPHSKTIPSGGNQSGQPAVLEPTSSKKKPLDLQPAPKPRKGVKDPMKIVRKLLNQVEREARPPSPDQPVEDIPKRKICRSPIGKQDFISADHSFSTAIAGALLIEATHRRVQCHLFRKLEVPWQDYRYLLLEAIPKESAGERVWEDHGALVFGENFFAGWGRPEYDVHTVDELPERARRRVQAVFAVQFGLDVHALGLGDHMGINVFDPRRSRGRPFSPRCARRLCGGRIENGKWVHGLWCRLSASGVGFSTGVGATPAAWRGECRVGQADVLWQHAAERESLAVRRRVSMLLEDYSDVNELHKFMETDYESTFKGDGMGREYVVDAKGRKIMLPPLEVKGSSSSRSRSRSPRTPRDRPAGERNDPAEVVQKRFTQKKSSKEEEEEELLPPVRQRQSRRSISRTARLDAAAAVQSALATSGDVDASANLEDMFLASALAGVKCTVDAPPPDRSESGGRAGGDPAGGSGGALPGAAGDDSATGGATSSDHRESPLEGESSPIPIHFAKLLLLKELLRSRPIPLPVIANVLRKKDCFEDVLWHCSNPPPAAAKTADMLPEDHHVADDPPGVVPPRRFAVRDPVSLHLRFWKKFTHCILLKSIHTQDLECWRGC